MGSYGKPIAFGHRMQGIHKEVQENLLYLLAIEHYRRQAFCEFLVDTDGPGIRADLDEIEAGRDHLVEVFLLKLRLAILRVVENLLNKPFDPRDIFTHDGAELSEEFGIVLSLRAQLDECLNGGERISDFVGKPPGDCFKRAETIRAVNQGFLLSKIFIEQGVVQGYSRILRQRKQQLQILLRVHVQVHLMP